MGNNMAIRMYTDGACSGNPGAGGWACIIKVNGKAPVELQGGAKLTTNNQMELSGVIEGMKYINNNYDKADITIYSDSQYICKAFNERWIDNWQMNGWKTSTKKEVANVEMWKTLLKLIANYDVKFEWVRGHNGHPENERCDKMAVMQRDLHK